jgi:tRNA (adenine57-N1/adenine58-N1)-methyltransferase
MQAFGKKAVRPNDFAIVYEGPENIKRIKIADNEVYSNKFGAFDHSSILSKPYGTKIMSRRGDRHIYTLAPTAELWAQSLTHRTQVLYRADKSMIISQLDIKPGKIVVESGTGSASLTTALARAVMPTGKVFTFEFNEFRAAEAQREIRDLGVEDYVVSEHRDVLLNGFKHPLLEKADCVFLDLPNPWEAMQHAKDILKEEGRLCSFSPCIEQVQKSTKIMEDLGFKEIRTYETLLRPFMSRRSEGGVSIQGLEQDRIHTGYLTFAIN